MNPLYTHTNIPRTHTNPIHTTTGEFIFRLPTENIPEFILRLPMEHIPQKTSRAKE